MQAKCELILLFVLYIHQFYILLHKNTDKSEVIRFAGILCDIVYVASK